MKNPPGHCLAEVIGKIPFRMALAGGWIDQPFVSRLNPEPPGSMVVVGLEPTMRFMERAGMATGTRQVALRLWKGMLPDRDPAELVRELYTAENQKRQDPSGSQDMIGLVYPGINRLDYDFDHEGGIFPRQIVSHRDPATVRWLETVMHLIPVMQRPERYHPLGTQHLEPEWIRRLGQSGQLCFESIVKRDLAGLGASMNACMECWEAILPHTVRHPTIHIDLLSLMHYYRNQHAGAMYSGCGGGYLLVASDQPVAGSLKVTIRI
jgi:hypothetical protein